MTDPKTPTARQQRTSTLSRARILCVLVVAGLLGTASALQAATVQWNPNPESDIAGYKLSYGTQTGVYTTSVDTGNVTTWNLTLTPGTRYFVVLQAYNTGGLYSPYSAEVIYDAPPAPTLTSLSPSSGPVATAVTISGSNFGSTKGTSTVTFNGITATPTTWSTTSIVAPVPAGATTGNVLVTVGGVASNALTYTVSSGATPTLTSLSPSSGPVGDRRHDQRHQLRCDPGHEHGHLQRHRRHADDLVRDAASSSRCPAGATTGNVVVTVGGLASNALTLHRDRAADADEPVADERPGRRRRSRSPARNFGATKGTSTVTFNGTTATPTTWSATQHRRPRAGRRDDRQRRRHRRRRGEQRR